MSHKLYENFEKEVLTNLILTSFWTVKSDKIFQNVQIKYKGNIKSFIYNSNTQSDIVKYCIKIDHPTLWIKDSKEEVLRLSKSVKLNDLIKNSCVNFSEFGKSLKKAKRVTAKMDFEGVNSLKKVFKKHDFEEAYIIDLYRLTKIESIQIE